MDFSITRVRTGFGMLWKLKMPFSRTCKVFGKEINFITAMEKFWIFVWKNCKHILKWM